MTPPATKHKVVLTDDRHAELHRLLRQTSVGVARKRWATILLLADEAHPDGRKTDELIADDVGISARRLGRLRKKFVVLGFDATLARSTRFDAGVPKVLDGPAEAHLVALCCTTPPDGRDRRTLQLPCDELARLQVVTSVCLETVRRCLKKTRSGRGRPNGSASPRPTACDSSPPWKRCSTSANAPTTRRTR